MSGSRVALWSGLVVAGVAAGLGLVACSVSHSEGPANRAVHLGGGGSEREKGAARGLTHFPGKEIYLAPGDSIPGAIYGFPPHFSRAGGGGKPPQAGLFLSDGRSEDVAARSENVFRSVWGVEKSKSGGPAKAPKVRRVRPGALQGRVQPGEELWVIARDMVDVDGPGRDDRLPGSGAMVARLPLAEGKVKSVPMPLAHTDVKARVGGYIATVDVTQKFHNPYDSTIEAVYVFPLPSNGAVNQFVMTVGKRRIRGVIRGRKEAEKIYRQARRQGYTASLMTQERPNIFTQKVANIDPGKRIAVSIRYFNTLRYVDGAYEFVFPMVVGPRYNPPGSKGGVGAVARGQAGASGQKAEVQYLRPHERSGHDIALRLELDAGVELEGLTSPTHRIVKAAGESPSRAVVTLAADDRIPNKDFVLRYRVAGGRVKSGLVTHRDRRGGYFTFMLYPPAALRGLSRAPVEMIFVLDCSGSMSGRPMAQAKAAVMHALGKLGPQDTFQVIRFSNDASQLGDRPLPATEANRALGRKYLAGLKGSGGTQMIEGIKAALAFPQEEGRTRYVVFLTDGYIGNEKEIVGEMHRRLGRARVFSFGVGSSVNRYLMRSMARVGRGTVAYLLPQEKGEDVMDYFFQRISHPALTDIEIDWGGMQVSQVYPKRIPDLFVGRPVILTGRFTGGGGPIRIRGKAAGRPVTVEAKVAHTDGAGHTGLPAVWARTLIADLATAATRSADPSGELPGTIKRVALEYQLLSAYTAFVAIDSQARTKAEEGTTVPVATPVPAGVKYRTTVKPGR